MRRWLNEHVAWPGDIMFFERDWVGVGGLTKLLDAFPGEERNVKRFVLWQWGTDADGNLVRVPAEADEDLR